MAAPACSPAVLPHESTKLMRGRAGVVTAQLSRLPWCKNKKKVAIIASGIRVARSLTYHSPVDEAHLNFCKNLWLRDQSSTKRISQRHRVDSNLFRKYTFVSHASPLGLCSAHPSGRWEVESTGCNASTSDQSAIDLSTPDSELREVLTVTQQPHDKESENLGHPGFTAVEAGQSITQVADEHTGFVVVNFYRLTNIPDPLAEVAKHQEFVKDKDIKGRIYISEQGLNAQLSGPGEEALQYAKWVEDQPPFRGMYLQVSPAPAGHAFPRLNLRYKPSLVQVEGGTACLPLTDGAHGAIFLSPQEWREKFEGGSEEGGGRKVLLLDVRNAARPEVENFRDTDFGMDSRAVPESDPLGGIDRAETDVMMYCTGGIRCDVYSTMLNLREAGFERLYSLQGGMARYLQEEGGKHWVGKLFVFDSRLCVSGR